MSETEASLNHVIPTLSGLNSMELPESTAPSEEMGVSQLPGSLVVLNSRSGRVYLSGEQALTEMLYELPNYTVVLLKLFKPLICCVSVSVRHMELILCSEHVSGAFLF